MPHRVLQHRGGLLNLVHHHVLLGGVRQTNVAGAKTDRGNPGAGEQRGVGPAGQSFDRRGESVRGAKDGDEDDKPMLPPPAPAAERKSLFGGLFGGKK